MRKYFIVPVLVVLAVGLLAPIAFSQTTGTVRGVCKDAEGKPIVGATVLWVGVESGHTYTLKTDKKGEYLQIGVVPGKYNLKLNGADGKQIWSISNIPVGLDETTQDIDLKKEQVKAAEEKGMTPEQAAAQAAQREKAAKEGNTVKTLNEKIREAGAFSDAGDYDKAIASLNEANALDNTRDPIWAKLGDVYTSSAKKQTDPDEKKKRYDEAAVDFQKAIDLRKGSDQAQKDPQNSVILANYYNNLANAYSKNNKVDDAIANYNLAAQLDAAHPAMYYFNEGAVLTNAGKADEAIAAFDKVIAADPTKAAAYYYKGINLIGKATLKGDKMVAPDGTAEAFQKYIELDPNGPMAQTAKDMLAQIGATVETGFGTKKKPAPKKQ
ncbi:MAG: carboxypeptidase regulatory-like domain-containing protein [Terriglobales bacterium]|jgi:tetratricopeptide (TPR) repeat protein